MIWKHINGFSNYMVNQYGDIININRNNKLKRSHITKYGYRRITLCNNYHVKHYFIHRLIAEYFIPNKHNYPCVNHIDGNKLNNSIENLEWCNHSKNNKHAYLLGLNKKRSGESHPRSKLSQDDVNNIRKIYSKGGTTYRKLAIMYNVTYAHIGAIVRMKIW